MTLSSQRSATVFSIALTVLALFATACGDDAPEPLDAPVLTIRNETDCNVHIRFDNGRPVASVGPGAIQDYRDDALSTYRYMQVESTMAIFRNLELAPIREAGWDVTIKDAVGDGECVDVPATPT